MNEVSRKIPYNAYAPGILPKKLLADQGLILDAVFDEFVAESPAEDSEYQALKRDIGKLNRLRGLKKSALGNYQNGSLGGQDLVDLDSQIGSIQIRGDEMLHKLEYQGPLSDKVFGVESGGNLVAKKSSKNVSDELKEHGIFGTEYVVRKTYVGPERYEFIALAEDGEGESQCSFRTVIDGEGSFGKFHDNEKYLDHQADYDVRIGEPQSLREDLGKLDTLTDMQVEFQKQIWRDLGFGLAFIHSAAR